VPGFSNYSSITDLQSAKMNITGIDLVAGVMEQTRNAIEANGLDHLHLTKTIS
jgi:hypothetical protein